MADNHLEIEARWGTILGEDNERMSTSRPLEAVKPWQTSQIQRVFVYVLGQVVDLVVG